MGEPFVLQWGEAQRSIWATQERLANPKPVLREFSRHLTADIKENIRSGGSGWAPYGASTLKRLESTGTSQVSRRGTVRADRVRRTLVQLRQVQKAVQDGGWTPKLRAKYDRLEKRIANYRKAEERTKKKAAGNRKIGPRVAEKHALLHRIPGTIRSKIQGNVLITYSKADEVGLVHNEGAGRDPKREFLPPPNMEANLEYLAGLLESDLGQAWETGRGR